MLQEIRLQIDLTNAMHSKQEAIRLLLFANIRAISSIRQPTRYSEEFFLTSSSLSGSFPALLFQQSLSDDAHHPIVKAVGHESRHEYQRLGIGGYRVAGLGRVAWIALTISWGTTSGSDAEAAAARNSARFSSA